MQDRNRGERQRGYGDRDGQSRRYGQQDRYGQQEQYDQGSNRYGSDDFGSGYGRSDDDYGSGYRSGSGDFGGGRSDYGSNDQYRGGSSFGGGSAYRGGSSYGGGGGFDDRGSNYSDADFSREQYGRDQAYSQGRSGRYGQSGNAGRGFDRNASYSDYDRESARGGGYNRDHRGDRGFFEKAGDEIASWFGDDDAQQRRDRDHRGRGPSNYTRSDDRIRDDVCDNLTDDWALDASSIEVTVDGGEVTLDGTVESRGDKRRAEDQAYRISGINHVQNNLRVESSSSNYGSSTYGSSDSETQTTTQSTTVSE